MSARQPRVGVGPLCSKVVEVYKVGGGGKMLRYSADLRSVLWVALWHLGSTQAMAHGCETVLGAWVVGGILAYLAFACACITHNSMHCRTWHWWVLEEIWMVALSLAYGHPAFCFDSGHNKSHHRFTQQPKDVMRTSKMRFRWHILNLVLFQPTVAGAVFRQDMRYWWARRGSVFFWRGCVQWCVVLATQAVLCWLNWRRFLAYVWAPHLFAQCSIVSINVIQHDGAVVPKEGKKDINMARTLSGFYLNVLTFNNGYHTMHHYSPTLHWSLLPAAHAQVIQPFIDPRLNEPCLLRYLWRTFVVEGRRDFRGKPLQFAHEEPPDEDWVSEYQSSRQS